MQILFLLFLGYSLVIFSQFSLHYIVHGLLLAAFQQKLAIRN